MKKYLRFGQVPKNGKSINFLKMSMEQVDAFGDVLRVEGYEAAMETVPEDALEAGVSAFEIDGQELALDNLRNISEVCVRVCQDEPAYVVTGEEAGRGNGGEPLLQNVKVLARIEIDKKAAQEYAVEVMKRYYRTAVYEGGPYSGEVYVHYPFDPEHPSAPAKEETYLCGWKFTEPIEGFDTSLGIRERH